MLYAVECHQDMLTHRATHKEADLPCNKCDFKTKNVVELEEHIKTVHGVLVYRCNQCEFSCHAIEELWKHKMINHEAYEALSSDSTNSMLQMLLISMSGQIEYVVENMARLKIEATEGFKENRIQGDILEEKISKIEEKLEENRVALAKTFRFDAKIRNDSVAVLSRVVDKCERLENILLSAGSKKDTVTGGATKATAASRTTPAGTPEHSPTQTYQPGEELVPPQSQPSTETRSKPTPTRKIYSEMKRTNFLGKPNILYVGDSIAHNANFANIEQETKSRMKTVKAYSSTRDNRARWPHKNVNDVTKAALKNTHENDEFDHLVIGAPSVDITNINTSKLSVSDNIAVFEKNVVTSCHNTFAVAQNAIQNHHNIKKVVIMQHAPRFDEQNVDPSGLKPKLAKLANSTLSQLWHSSVHKDKIVIGHHNLDCSGDLVTARYRDERTNRYGTYVRQFWIQSIHQKCCTNTQLHFTCSNCPCPLL